MSVIMQVLFLKEATCTFGLVLACFTAYSCCYIVPTFIVRSHLRFVIKWI